MQTQQPEASLFDLLGQTIKQLERIEDDPKTLTFIARRVGNIVKHMKDLREDLQPRGGHATNPRTMGAHERPSQRVETMR
jgi:hypothetical protein